MYELAIVFVKHKKDFIDLLNDSGIFADERMSDQQLADSFVDNVGSNKKLRLGAAYLVNMRNKQIGFDGTGKVSNEGVKISYDVLSDYFVSANGENDLQSEDYANVPGVLGAISGIVQSGAGVANKAMEGQQKKKYGALDMATKQQESKSILTQQILAQKQQQIEADKLAQQQKQKTTRTILVVGGIVVGLVVIGLIIYKIKKGKSAK
jgi:hypothetical protein